MASPSSSSGAGGSSSDADVTSGGDGTSGTGEAASTETPGEESVQPWAIATDIRISVWPDVDEAWLEGLLVRVQDASDLLWTVTEGQHYVGEVSVRDATQSVFGSGGIHFHIENLSSDRVDSASNVYGYWDAAHSIHLGGAFQIFTFVHEWGHVAYGLPDEYAPQCGQCMMASSAWEFCDADTHDPASHPVPCWDLILAAHPDWRHPNEDHAAAPPPIDVVELVDN